ncbi:hypothetical protein GY26_05285 [Gammaproteobacteria bacterium MFB021]|nr:hypothetical protein GY26_05285 [Gammaproteobacteria bacterium MFB021]
MRPVLFNSWRRGIITWPVRGLLLAATVALANPGLMSDFAGLAIIAVIYLGSRVRPFGCITHRSS